MKRNPVSVEKRTEYRRRYVEKNPDAVAGYDQRRYLAKFGLTTADYAAMLDAQGGVCAICKRPETATKADGTPKALALDHCHTENTARGLLCQRCNTAIGSLDDSEELLLAAIAYIRKYAPESAQS